MGAHIGDERVERPGWKGLLIDCLRGSKENIGEIENWYTGESAEEWLAVTKLSRHN